jgi:hypothetical protein
VGPRELGFLVVDGVRRTQNSEGRTSKLLLPFSSLSPESSSVDRVDLSCGPSTSIQLKFHLSILAGTNHFHYFFRLLKLYIRQVVGY